MRKFVKTVALITVISLALAFYSYVYIDKNDFSNALENNSIVWISNDLGSNILNDFISKGMRFDNFFGKDVKMLDFTADTSKEYSLDELESINIESAFVDVEISQSSDDSFKIIYTGTYTANKENELIVSVIDKKLKLSFPKNIRATKSTLELKVFVPEKALEEIDVYLASGSFNGLSLSAESLTIRSASGDISLKDIESKNIITESASGNIIIEETTATLNSSTVSGDIKISNTSARKYTLNSISGNIELFGGSGITALNTVSGDIHLTTSDTFDDLVISSISGSISVEGLNSGNYTITLESLSGDINSSLVGKIEKLSSREFKVIVNNGAAKVSIDTVSGDIEIHE